MKRLVHSPTLAGGQLTFCENRLLADALQITGLTYNGPVVGVGDTAIFNVQATGNQ